MSDTPRVPREAGRELDALVAEKVMGLMPALSVTAEPLVLAPVSGGFTSQPVKHYSTDIRAAWEVVMALDVKQIVTSVCNDDCQIFYVRMWDRNAPYAYYPTENAVNASSNSAPHAICLAALKAVHRE